MKNSLAYLVATGLFSGKSPFAPGTAGSLLCAIILYCGYSLIPVSYTITNLLILSTLLSVTGIWAITHCYRYEIYTEEHHDPKEVVIDEFAGMTLTLVAVPLSPLGFIIAFFWFRIFDVLKPPPVSNAEQLPGSWGIMCDDLVAGAYAAIACYITFSLLL